MSKDYVDQQGALTEVVIQMMTDVVALLNTYGIGPVPAGNVMRLLGVPEEEAGNWDNVMLTIDEQGKLTLNTDDEEYVDNTSPTTLH